MQDLHFFLVDHGGALVAGYVLSAAEATSKRADVLIIDDTSSILSRRLVIDLQRMGTAVVGVFDDSEGDAGRRRLEELGVDECIRGDAPPGAFLAVIEMVATAENAPTSPDPERRSSNQGPAGRVVAVVAASGGTGATEIAVALGAMLRSRSRSVVVVDADDVTPSIAQRLGLPVYPNLWTAAEAVVHGGGGHESAVVVHESGLGVLCGLAGASRASLPADDVSAVLRELAADHSVVVANASAKVGLPGRAEGAHISPIAMSVLAAAGSVVLVGAASPVGVTRIVSWLSEAGSLIRQGDVHLVLNRFPGGGFRAAEIVDELLLLSTPRSVTVVPADQRVQRAEWRGTIVRRGPFQRAMAHLAHELETSWAQA
jgi:MinD-like ATPase involved in chromosome partitioning or flagellar assembly